MDEMHELSDAQLLRNYAERGDESAFREIVTRHADLIYSSALRQVGSPDLASDVTQSVFTDLARKADSLTKNFSKNASLLGWLYRSTRFAALNQLRDDRRRQTHEREIMEQLDPTPETSTEWESIRPALDEAMADLSDVDREALLLRFFKNHDFRTVGQMLGVSDDAAQKRVSRAVDRLRELFSKRNVTIGASGLVVLISTNAVQAAPIGLFSTISSAASLFAVQTSTTIAATKTIAMTTLQKTLAVAAVTILVGAGGYEALRIARSDSGPHTTAAAESIKGQLFGPGQLVDAGNTTPEAAWVSRYWARAQGDYDAVIAATAPQAVEGAKAWMGNKATFRAGSQEEFASFKGLQILARKNLASDRVELKYQFAFQKIGSTRQETKIVEMVKIDGAWRSGATRTYDASWDDGSQPEPLL